MYTHHTLCVPDQYYVNTISQIQGSIRRASIRGDSVLYVIA